MDHEREIKQVVDKAVELGLLDLSILPEELVQDVYDAAYEVASCLEDGEEIVAPLFWGEENIFCLLLTNRRVLETVLCGEEERFPGHRYILDGCPLRNLTALLLEREENSLTLEIEAGERSSMGGYIATISGLCDDFAENFSRLYEQKLSHLRIPAFPRLEEPDRSHPFHIYRKWRPVIRLGYIEAVEKLIYAYGSMSKVLLIGGEDGPIPDRNWEAIRTAFPHIPKLLSGQSFSLGSLVVPDEGETDSLGVVFCCAAVKDEEGSFKVDLNSLKKCIEELSVHSNRRYMTCLAPWGVGCDGDMSEWPAVREAMEMALASCREDALLFFCKDNG